MPESFTLPFLMRYTEDFAYRRSLSKTEAPSARNCCFPAASYSVKTESPPSCGVRTLYRSPSNRSTIRRSWYASDSYSFFPLARLQTISLRRELSSFRVMNSARFPYTSSNVPFSRKTSVAVFSVTGFPGRASSTYSLSSGSVAPPQAVSSPRHSASRQTRLPARRYFVCFIRTVALLPKVRFFLCHREHRKPIRQHQLHCSIYMPVCQ